MMYTNKENVNILTALLVEHGVRHAVVCPGSRNAPITHNLVVCPDIECCNVVDERSAGFYALGMALATACPVAVCVTSGTALLNLMPAVAEASYQRVPLVVVSADRPPQWIDQLDGQTLPQGDALGRFVRKAVMLPEPHDDEERWFCNRLVNEALLAARRQGGGPVHINVPLSEPLYEYTVEALHDERTIFFAPARSDKRLLAECAGELSRSRRPMIVVGQTKRDDLLAEDFAGLRKPIVVLNEALSIGCGACHFDEVLDKVTKVQGNKVTQEQGNKVQSSRFKVLAPSSYASEQARAQGAEPTLREAFTPDFVLYLGGELVSKRLKQCLRQLPASTQVWAVSEDGEVRDTFCHLHGVIEGHPADVLADLSELTADVPMKDSSEFFELWDNILASADEAIERSEPSFSPMAAVRLLEEALDKETKEQRCGVARHYANSTAVRLANRYARGYVWCNRGVNGIEGTLSTAAGFSLVSDEEVVCVIGDLSFFYDQNALWQRALSDNLRILLLNNGGGGIFERFEGLRESPARDCVMARHTTSAEGICQSYNVQYRAARSMEELREGIGWLTTQETPPHPSPKERGLNCPDGRPRLLEVFSLRESEK